jgi:Fe-S cluster assembly protein SufD
MLDAGAQLTHYHIQQEEKTAYNLASIYVQQERDSQFTSHALNLGARLSRHDINVQLVAPGVSCFLNGLYMMQGRQHHDTHTRIDHLVPHGTSREDYKGILDDFAHAVFNGKVIVHPGAMQTDAEQSNKNLLLSNEAEVDTKPQLEIFADDVKCAHGATVGQLDEEALFFLRSRGIDQATARDLLVYGFAGSVIDNIQHTAVREVLKQAVLADLMRGTRLGEIMR